VVPVYLAARAAGVVRWCAVVGVVLAMTTPWNAWLGVATVPEALTGALVASGAIAVGVRKARGWAAFGLLCAALSRYEAWPVCAVLGAVCGVGALRGLWQARGGAGGGVRATADAKPAGARGDQDELSRAWDLWGRNLACAGIATAGPLLWMAWNGHVHDGPLHFLRRVVAYRDRVAPVGGTEALVAFPRALLQGAPEIVGVAALGTIGLALDPELRRRWACPLATTGALVAFLIAGDWRGGAPTHHPERALLAAWWVLAVFGVDGVRAVARRLAWARPKREAWAAAAAAAAVMSWGWGLTRIRTIPGSGPDEARDTQVALGTELAERGVETIEVTPCRYEHFAVLAAFGAPERAVVEGRAEGTVGEKAECPRVVVR
jgi:hypothetical protein